jgi:phenylacetaldehyde dehydrogenase
MPFGGYKQSGYGKDLGSEQLDYLLETKAVWITLP